MIFGQSNASLWLKLPLLLTLAYFLGSGLMSGAETLPPPERAGESSLWTVEQLLAGLAKNRPQEVGFEETASSHLLTQPLKTQGILRFTPPATLEKSVTAPYKERYLVEGDKVFFESKAKRINKALSLQDYPVLRAFVEAFRSTLANDVPTLKRFYRVTLEGEPRRWTLILRPSDSAMQELVESIRFSGEGEQVKAIETLAPDGDRSLMVMTTDAQ
jgi:hypothetical protein